MQDTRATPRLARSRPAAGRGGEFVRTSGVARSVGHRVGVRATWFGAIRPGDRRLFSPA